MVKEQQSPTPASRPKAQANAAPPAVSNPTPFSIENPMHTNTSQTSTQPPTPPPNAPRRCPVHQIRGRVKGILLFLFSVVAVGFLYIASQAVTTATAGKIQEEHVQIRWWFRVDGVELMFYLFVLSAVFHFAVNATGGRSNRTHWCAVCVPLALLVSCILIGVAPTLYQQVASNVEVVEFDRGGCHSFKSVDEKFGVKAACRSINPDRFIRYNFRNRTEEEIRVLTGGIDLLRSTARGSDALAIQAKTIKPELATFVVETCVQKLFDFMCAEMYRECNVLDCSVPSSNCFKHNMMALINDWGQCGKRECDYDPKRCSEISNQTVVDVILPGLDQLMKEARELDIVDQMTQTLFSAMFQHMSGYLSDLRQNHVAPCQASLAEDLSAAALNGNITCNSTKQSYTRTTTHLSFNSVGMLSFVAALFSCCIVLFGGYDSLHFQLSPVRLGCCVVGLLMSSLVYMGSLHLYWSSIGNPVQSDAGLQRLWRALYLVVSYLCLHGGLLVLVPILPSVATVEENQTQQEAADVDQDLFCSLCGNTTCCRRGGTCGHCFKTLHFFKSLKEEVWDASGVFFPLKLMLMEMVEVAIQINSLTSGAKTSHVDDVVLSAIIIAANLIVLPVVIILGPKCLQSSASSSDVSTAAVMVIEVLFDKLYVGVGVLLRYDTLTRRNMAFTDQLSVHLALLLPALMTALDVNDALVLAEHMEATSTRKTHASYRSSSFARVAGKVGKMAHSTVFFRIGKCGLFSSVVVGIALATYTLIAASMAHSTCEARIGPIASCAQEQYYFANGFFEHTTCAFEQVTSFKCNPGDSVAGLPNAAHEYALMTRLKLINVSNSNSLDKAPLGWAYVPNEQLIIDLHGSKQFYALPFQLCSVHTNLTTLNVAGTVAEFTIDWKRQLSATTVQSFDMNSACLVALEKLKTLSLADNNLKLSQIDDALLTSFTSLVHLDLRHNNITEFKILILDKRFTPILQRYVYANATTGGLQLAGNPIKQYWITAEARDEIVEEWIHILASLPYVLDVKFYGCSIDDRQLSTLAATLDKHGLVESLYLGGNQLVDVSSLGGLVRLKHLWLFDNRIKNMAGLETLVRLKTLRIYNNHITTMAGLGPQTEMEILNFDDNQCNNVTRLATLVNLKVLFLRENGISDVTPLSKLTKLQSLDLRNNKITDTTIIGTLVDLRHLCFENNHIANVEPLASLTRLTKLELQHNQITSISDSVGGLVRLKDLSLDGNLIHNVTGIPRSVEQLSLFDNQINDVSPLGDLVHLKGCLLSNNNITKVAPLSTLTSLQKLHLLGNQIETISELGTLVQLQELDLRKNPIANASIAVALLEAKLGIQILS